MSCAAQAPWRSGAQLPAAAAALQAPCSPSRPHRAPAHAHLALLHKGRGGGRVDAVLHQAHPHDAWRPQLLRRRLEAVGLQVVAGCRRRGCQLGAQRDGRHRLAAVPAVHHAPHMGQLVGGDVLLQRCRAAGVAVRHRQPRTAASRPLLPPVVGTPPALNPIPRGRKLRRCSGAKSSYTAGGALEQQAIQGSHLEQPVNRLKASQTAIVDRSLGLCCRDAVGLL